MEKTTNYLTAIHEAGHCLAFLRKGVPVLSVTVQANATQYGSCRFKPPEISGTQGWRNARNIVFGCLAGEAAELAYKGTDEPITAAGLDGWESIQALSKFGPNDCKQIVTLAREELAVWLPRNMPRIEQLARRLMRVKTLSGDEVRRMFP